MAIEWRQCDACYEGNCSSCKKGGRKASGAVWQCNCSCENTFSEEEKKEKKRIRKLLEEGRELGQEARREMDNALRPSGLYELSRCCNAPVTLTTGGVRLAICSKCRNTVVELKFGL